MSSQNFASSSSRHIDPDTSVRVRTADAHDNEFRYYSKLLQDLVILLTNQQDKEAVLPWIHKLSSPAYNVQKLRNKRNHYMLMLCISLLMDTIEGPFVNVPPEGILPDLQKIDKPPKQIFEWETDKTWKEQLKLVSEIEENDEDKERTPYYLKRSKCPIHSRKCPSQSRENQAIGYVLDQQFQYLLWISKPYAAMLLRSSDRLRAAKWIQALCAIDGSYCALGKGVRNDYMVVLSGHLANQNLTGVFEDYPIDKLLPISVLAQIRTEKKPITDPTHPKTAEFFMNVPHPQEGAFALVAITGDLYEPKYK